MEEKGPHANSDWQAVTGRRIDSTMQSAVDFSKENLQDRTRERVDNIPRKKHMSESVLTTVSSSRFYKERKTVTGLRARGYAPARERQRYNKGLIGMKPPTRRCLSPRQISGKTPSQPSTCQQIPKQIPAQCGPWGRTPP